MWTWSKNDMKIQDIDKKIKFYEKATTIINVLQIIIVIWAIISLAYLSFGKGLIQKFTPKSNVEIFYENSKKSATILQSFREKYGAYIGEGFKKDLPDIIPYKNVKGLDINACSNSDQNNLIKCLVSGGIIKEGTEEYNFIVNYFKNNITDYISNSTYWKLCTLNKESVKRTGENWYICITF